MMSRLYSIIEANSMESSSDDIFIMAGEIDERTIAAAKIVSQKPNSITTVLMLKYDPIDEETVHSFFPDADIQEINVSSDPISFLTALQHYRDMLLEKRLMVDITAIRVPEIFMLFKYLKLLGKTDEISVLYSTPMEYEFQEEPFTSYHSFYGNLSTIDLPGYGGMSGDMAHSQMLIFLGFEGVLSEKVTEDIRYDKLKLINNLPSLYEKYKDISVINNYNLLATRHEKLSYVPANNPFEVYNYLEENLLENELACAAPLSTKPVALGVCLYALNHESLRVVYPTADRYVPHRANSVHKTYMYFVEIA